MPAPSGGGHDYDVPGRVTAEEPHPGQRGEHPQWQRRGLSAPLTVSDSWSSSDSPAVAAAPAGTARKVLPPGPDQGPRSGTDSSGSQPVAGRSAARHSTSRRRGQPTASPSGWAGVASSAARRSAAPTVTSAGSAAALTVRLTSTPNGNRR